VTCRRRWTAVAIAASCLVFAGCGDSAAHVALSAHPTPSPTSSSVAGPSVSAREICTEEEISNAITLTLGLNGRPPKSSSWVKPVFTCTYRLTEGPLILTVTEFPTAKAAQQSFNQKKSQYAQDKVPIQTLEALGVPSFLASDDVLLSIKTSHVLRVDVTQLPKTVGPLHRARRDLSYLVAQAILKCWSGD
jgi:hypothetical protein